MRVLRKDVAEGFLHLQLDSLDDLWTLRTVLQRGDLATATTMRTADVPGDKARDVKAEKRTMRLGLRVETVSWHDFDDHLRVLGPIETGPQDHGRYHTLVLRPGDDVQIQKRHRLEGWHLRLVEEAVARSGSPQVVLLAIDDAEAQFGLLKSYGVQLLGTLPSSGQGKRFAGAAEAKRQFYGEATKSLRLLRPDPAVPLLVVGPGWWREEFLDHLREHAPEQAKNTLTDGTSQGGRGGVHEALRRGLLERLARDHRVTQETALVERFLEETARGGAVAYGLAEVRRAVDAGAAATLLVSDERVRSGDVDELVRAAESARCEVRIVASSHEAGAQLAAMGGVAALLRYRLDA